MTISVRSAGLVILLLLAIEILVGCVQHKRAARAHVQIELGNVQCRQQSDGSITCVCKDPTQTAIDARDPAHSGKFRCSDASK